LFQWHGKSSTERSLRSTNENRNNGTENRKE
jgi:hypothetical protein